MFVTVATNQMYDLAQRMKQCQDDHPRTQRKDPDTQDSRTQRQPVGTLPLAYPSREVARFDRPSSGVYCHRSHPQVKGVARGP
jgi:hypothetical protein